MSTSKRFLETIQPVDGWKCGEVFEPGKKKPRRIWARTSEELGVMLENADAHGSTVYHAVSSYRERSTRKRENVLAIKSFWLDLDAGPGKPYVDMGQAVNALATFLHATRLPEPVLVGSGVGVHVYWPLQRQLTLAEWQPLANNLKDLCRKHGLQAGPERTGDAASILRPPGTHHRKDPNNVRPVIGGDPRGPYDLADLAALHNSQPVLGGGGVAYPVSRPGAPTGLTADLLNVHLDDPADADLVADQCQQMRAMRETRGDRLPEPLWYAGIGVLAFCADGEALAHEWSEGDERYDQKEVAQKFARAKALTGPTTCARFRDLNPSGCDGCPFASSVVSPVSLGRGELRPETIIAQAVAETQQDELPPLFEPFRWGPGGSVVWAREGRDGMRDDVTVVQYPTLIKALARGEKQINRHTAIVRHWQPHEGWLEHEVSMETLMGQNGIAKLAGLGVIVHDGDMFRRYVRQSIDVLAAKEKPKVIYEQFGWKADEQAYLLGNRLYARGAYTEVNGSNEVMMRAKALRPGGAKGRGSLEGWKAAADRLGALGSEAQLFGMMACVAAPLIKFFGDGEGGAVVSLVSHGGGKGKSTALYAGATFWGDRDGLEMVAIDTRVSKGITLGLAGNNPVIFDELRERDPESVRDFVQMFTQGRDKLRGTADGTLIHNAATWQTILLTASNKSLVDTIKATRGSEAMTTRVLEFTLPNLPGKEDIGLDRQFIENPGWAGSYYISALTTQDPALLRRNLDEIAEWLIRVYNFKSVHRFWIKTLAAIMVAGRIVNALGLITFSVERLVRWAVGELDQREETQRDAKREPAAPETQNAALEILQAYMAEHLDEMLIVPDQWRAGIKQLPIKVPQRHLTMRIETKPQRMYVTVKALREFCVSRDMSWVEFKHALVSSGVMDTRLRSMHLSVGTDIPGIPASAATFLLAHPKMSGMLVSVDELEERSA